MYNKKKRIGQSCIFCSSCTAYGSQHIADNRIRKHISQC